MAARVASAEGCGGCCCCCGATGAAGGTAGTAGDTAAAGGCSPPPACAAARERRAAAPRRPRLPAAVVAAHASRETARCRGSAASWMPSRRRSDHRAPGQPWAATRRRTIHRKRVNADGWEGDSPHPMPACARARGSPGADGAAAARRRLPDRGRRSALGKPIGPRRGMPGRMRARAAGDGRLGQSAREARAAHAYGGSVAEASSGQGARAMRDHGQPAAARAAAARAQRRGQLAVAQRGAVRRTDGGRCTGGRAGSRRAPPRTLRVWWCMRRR